MLDFEFPSISDIVKSAPGAREVIANGNYELAAKLAVDEGDEELAATAVLMAGSIRQGLDRLSKLTFRHAETDLYAAFGHWSNGYLAAALQSLAKISAPHLASIAAGLRTLIERETISVVVLADANNSRGAPLNPGGNFTVCHLDSADARDSLLAAPNGLAGFDLLLAYNSANETLLDAAARNNVPSVVVPTDFDQRLFELHALFERADIILGTTAIERDLLSHMYDTRVVSYPALSFFHHLGPVMPLPAGKDIDIFCSGMLFSPHWADKARLICRIAAIDDPNIAIRMRHGYVDSAIYRQDVARTKYLPLDNRLGFSITSFRTTEVLHYGAFGLAIDGVEARYILGDGGRRLPSVDPDRIETEIVDLIAAYDDLARTAAAAPATGIIEDFYSAPPYRDAKTLKFVLFQSLLQRAARETSTITPTVAAPKDDTRRRLTGKTVARYGAFMRGPLQADAQAALLDAFDHERSHHPGAVVPAFNKARVLWQIGRRNEAVQLFTEILSMPAAPGGCVPTDFLLSHLVSSLSSLMPYHAYYQGMVLDCANRDPTYPRAHSVIAATCLTYLSLDSSQNSRFDEGAHYAAQALALCNRHHPAAWQLTKAAFAANRPPQDILRAFLAASDLYPPLINELLPIGIDVMERQGLDDLAQTIVRKWLYTQSRIEFVPPHRRRIPRQTLDCATRYFSTLPDPLKVTLKKLYDELND